MSYNKSVYTSKKIWKDIEFKYDSAENLPMIKVIWKNCVRKGIVRLIVMEYHSFGRIARPGLGGGKV